jgi:hypothetical protein
MQTNIYTMVHITTFRKKGTHSHCAYNRKNESRHEQQI